MGTMFRQKNFGVATLGWKERFIVCVVACAAACTAAIAQTATYNDVLVVINSNSATSETIGTYFATARAIPSQHIARISVPTTEEIDSTTFENLRSQLESIIKSRGITDSINYIVTTKGMPLKVLRSSMYTSSSVESELTIILGPYAFNIGRYGRIYSPYYSMTTDFTRAKYGIYLVTRLDGYTVNDVEAMIDRASVIPATVTSAAQCVFDMDPSQTALAYLNTNMRKAATYLAAKGIASVVDSTSTYLTHQTNVLGYVSWGSNDAHWAPFTTHAIPHNTYVDGAIAETYVSTSGRTFTSPATYGQSLIADLVAEGITAAKGYVYEPYSSAMADVNILFTRYAGGYTVAESYYASSYFLSWMDVIIGDPKYRMVATRLPSDRTKPLAAPVGGALPVELTSFTAANAQNSASLTWQTATEQNNYGFDIERRQIKAVASQSQSASSNWSKIGFVGGHGTSNSMHAYSYNDATVSSGTYAYRLKQMNNDGTFQYSSEVEVMLSMPTALVLNQNYPNPFNPTTTMTFTLAEDGYTTLKIYDVLGKEIATLVSGEMKAGVMNTVTFNASKLSSGMYFSKLESHGNVQVRKLTLMK
jgi:uncharacterized protein (TIGR03790 family)